ncbi:hypothetical protein BH23CHL8_BH23CHL8_16850 [soil metagenome]
MKTTLNLDDQLLHLAKKSAADRGVTLTQVVEEALSAAILTRAQETGFRLRWTPVTGGRVPEIDVADRSALYDRMEGPR